MKTKQKTLLALLVFVLCAALFAVMTFTASAADVTLSGSGTRNDPYIVTSQEELVAASNASANVFVRLGTSFDVLSEFTVTNTEMYLDLNSYQLNVYTENGIVVQETSALYIFDTAGGGTINNNHNADGWYHAITNHGTLYIENNVTIKVYTHGNCALKNYGTATIRDGKITAHIYNEGTLNIEGGEISQTIDNYGTVNISGGTVTTSSICINNYAKLSITGGSLSSTTPVGNPAGAETTVTGGTITGEWYGISNGGTLTISGGTITGEWYGINNVGTLAISGGTLIKGIDNNSVPVKNCLADGFGFYDANGNLMVIEDGQTIIDVDVQIKTHTHTYNDDIGKCDCGTVLFEGTGTADNPYIVTRPGELKLVFQYGGTVYIKLGSDITGNADITPTNNTTAYLDLNGKTLDYGSEYLKISGGYTFVVSDSVGEGKISGNSDGIHNNGGTLIVNSGTVASTDSAIYNQSGILTINGGMITGTNYGINILNGTATVNGGTINSENIGVSVGAGALTLYGGTINGTADYGVSVNTGTFEMSDGTVNSENTGVYVGTGTFKMSGGTVNSTGYHGVYLYRMGMGTLTLSGGAINGGVTTTGKNLTESLAEGCVFFVEGFPVVLSADQVRIDYDVTVGICTHRDTNVDYVCDACGAIEVNENNFPDAAFRDYVNTNYAGGDNMLTLAEIAAVTEIDLLGTANVQCNSLKGVEFFTALEILRCSNENLTELDLSKNTELEQLCCDYNKLTSLNISGLSKLTLLDCQVNELKTLDVSSNALLIYLNCAYNELTTLDISGNLALTKLNCGGNHITVLDLSQHTELVEFYGSGQTATWSADRDGNITLPEGVNNVYVTLDVIANINGNVLTLPKGVTTFTFKYYTGNISSANSMYLQTLITVEGPPKTVYFKNTDGWETVNIYMWGANGNYAEWPGVPAEYAYTDDDGVDVYSYKVSEIYTSIIFNNGTLQTADFTLIPCGIYTTNSSGINHITEEGSNICKNCGVDVSENDDNNTFTTYRVYFTYEKGINIYMWNDNHQTVAAWPGAAMNLMNTGNGEILYYDVPANMTNIIFSSDTSWQTVDIMGFKPCGHYTLGGTDSDSGHYTVNVVVEHTFGDDHVCQYCGVKKAEVSQVSVTLDGDIGVNFYWTLDDTIINDATAYFLVTLPNGDTETILVSEAPKGTPIGSSTEYYKITGYVAAKEMAEDIVVELYAGGELIASGNCSVRGYAERVFEAAEKAPTAVDAELVSMMKAMLNYGAASQTLLGYNTSDLANSILEVGDKNVAAITEADVTPAAKVGSVAGITPTNFSCILETKTTLRHYFTIESGSIEGYTFKVGDTAVDPTLVSGNTYYVDIENISAADLGTAYTFTITDGTTTQTITASVESYMNSVIVNKDNENLVSPELLATVYAMHAYGTSAETYFN